MKTARTKLLYRLAALLLLILSSAISLTSWARAGGGGGHSSGGHGGYSGNSYGGGGYGFGGGFGSPMAIIIVVIIVLLINYYKKQNAATANNAPNAAPSQVSFPEGLDTGKVATSFMAIQDAWQRKDLTNVRKWLSDGMYQRFTTQFKMMDILGQKNTLSNIRITGIASTNTGNDGNYYTAEVAISFSMDDSFTSSKYPQFNETYPADTDTEYWTFIKRTGAENEKNLYDNNSCPNCGAPFEVKMGEISRCSNCNTLTNSAAYDWVLSEITQASDYSGGAGLTNEPELRALMQNDPFFSVQRMEDIASNIFMQIMQVLTTADNKRLTRFADGQVAATITGLKQSTKPFVFDRLYLNNVTLVSYKEEGLVMQLYFEGNATYRRATIDGRLQMIDNDFVTSPFRLELSRNKDVMHKANAGETVYSYECSSCGAPFTDTTADECTYCGAPVIDKQRNWVLTGFEWGNNG